MITTTKTMIIITKATTTIRIIIMDRQTTIIMVRTKQLGVEWMTSKLILHPKKQLNNLLLDSQVWGRDLRACTRDHPA